MIHSNNYMKMEEKKIVKVTNLTEIIGTNFLQNMQDFFATTMGIAILCIDNNQTLSEASNFTDFCNKKMNNKTLSKEHYCGCLTKGIKTASKTKKPIVFQCQSGLTNFAIPLLVNGLHVATLVGGQILTEPTTTKKLMATAKKLNIDAEEFITKMQKVRIMPLDKFEIIIDSLSIAANAVAAIAYANLQLAELNLDYTFPQNVSLEKSIFLNCEKVEKPLTEREFEVLKLIVLGKSNNEIAKDLFISVHTAKAHVSSIIDKFKVEDRVQMAVKAVRKGLI